MMHRPAVTLARRVQARCAVSVLRRTVSTSSAVSAPLAQPTQPQRASKISPILAVPLEHVSLGGDYESVTLGDSMKPSLQKYRESFQDLKVRDVLKSKARYGDTLHTVRGSDSVAIALQSMAHLGIGALLVVGADGHAIIGIISTRDVVKCVEEGKSLDASEVRVEQLMSVDPVFTYSDASALASLELMQGGGFRHLPVRDRSSTRTIGLVSQGDLVRTLLKSFQDKNAYLESFVSGEYSA